jgi:hypothetical protein
MTELSVVPLSSIILSLVLAVDGYNKTKEIQELASTKNNFLVTIVSLALFLVVAVVAVVLKPSGSMARMILSASSVILLLIALVASWLNYVNNTGGILAAQTLSVAIITAIPLLSTLVSKDTFTLKLNF